MDLNGVVLVTSVTVLILSIIYWRIKTAYGFFAKQGITGPNPAFPLGTWTKSARTSIGNEDKQIINKHGSLVGTFDGLTPNLLIADVDTVKKILTTYAAQFKSRRAEEAKNKTLTNVLQILENDSQNDVTPILSTPINRARISKLVPRLEASSNEFVRNLIKARQDNILSINDAVSDFTHDATALVLVGVELNADPVYRQSFIRNCENLFPGADYSSGLAIIPYLYGSIDNAIATNPTIEYFRNLIATELMERCKQEETNTSGKAVDFIDIILQISRDEEKAARKEKEQENVEDSVILTKQVVCDHILAAVFTFNYWMRHTLLFSIYALARNQDVQEKLFEEVKKKLGSDELNDQLLEKLPYLNGFIKEVQRMYPVEARLEKVAAEDVDLSETLKLKKGTRIIIPIFALHTSKQYHSDPKTFEPKRFLNASYEVENPLIQTPSHTVLSTLLSTLAIKTSLTKMILKLKFSGTADESEILQTGAPFVSQVPDIRVIAEIRE